VTIDYSAVSTVNTNATPAATPAAATPAPTTAPTGDSASSAVLAGALVALSGAALVLA